MSNAKAMRVPETQFTLLTRSLLVGTVISALAVCASAQNDAGGNTLSGADNTLSAADSTLSGADSTLSEADSTLSEAELARVLALQEERIELVERISPAYVRIGGGSGVVVTPDGIMITNNHVVAGQPKTMKIFMPGGHTFDASVLGNDTRGDVTVSDVRGGNKPGTRVFTVKGETHGVPTLVIGDG
jgi:S1-C subfamily serine protease